MLSLMLFLAVGVVVGLLAGLFGIGGGVIIVPVLILVFTVTGFDAAVLTQLAIGTSLATIIITSVSSALAHHRLGNVDWRIVRALAPGIALGVFAGGQLAGQLSGSLLQLLFGCFGVLVALQMATRFTPTPGRTVPGAGVMMAVGALFGGLSGLFGIGGGSLTVPFLHWCNLSMQRAVAASAACGVPIAVFGALSYLVAGWGRPELPAWSTGFIYWPALLGLALSAAPMTRFGARAAQGLSSARLRQLFAGFLLLVSIQFIVRNL
ncbi:MAG TPA: sulfite exporter TauE/SafE family protein [Spongiibacteraceae bacterium]|jgi:uncharacterized membrane protein YfcA|nr:sulfite exporter TauE/SafE family protein [Spongiibacteraceae bacterium]HUH36961.1 sulfite exporter TauE/SafE family protein [Spongiibacteraceae bacterium]